MRGTKEWVFTHTSRTEKPGWGGSAPGREFQPPTPPPSNFSPWGKTLLEVDSQSCRQTPPGLLSHKSAGWSGEGGWGGRSEDCADIGKRRNISHKKTCASAGPGSRCWDRVQGQAQSVKHKGRREWEWVGRAHRASRLTPGKRTEKGPCWGGRVRLQCRSETHEEPRAQAAWWRPRCGKAWPRFSALHAQALGKSSPPRVRRLEPAASSQQDPGWGEGTSQGPAHACPRLKLSE